MPPLKKARSESEVGPDLACSPSVLPKTTQTKEERDNSKRHVHPTAKARTKHAAEVSVAEQASEEKRLGFKDEAIVAEEIASHNPLVLEEQQGAAATGAGSGEGRWGPHDQQGTCSSPSDLP